MGRLHRRSVRGVSRRRDRATRHYCVVAALGHHGVGDVGRVSEEMGVGVKRVAGDVRGDESVADGERRGAIY